MSNLSAEQIAARLTLLLGKPPSAGDVQALAALLIALELEIKPIRSHVADDEEPALLYRGERQS